MTEAPKQIVAEGDAALKLGLETATAWFNGLTKAECGAFATAGNANAAAATLQEAISCTASAAATINSGAGEVRTASDDLSRRTEHQAASLEETAAALEEITATVRSTADRAGNASVAAGSVRNEAEKADEIVHSAMSAMAGIDRSVREMSEIVLLIDGIAFQINLLALNAGVEAARAGDAAREIRDHGRTGQVDNQKGSLRRIRRVRRTRPARSACCGRQTHAGRWKPPPLAHSGRARSPGRGPPATRQTRASAAVARPCPHRPRCL